jgi:4-hydroxy-4-methyl-2-oxoglutarate aldolase
MMTAVNYPIRKIQINYDVVEIQQRYEKLYAGLVSDALEALGYHHQCMQSGIYPLTHTMKVAGPAFTAHGISTPSKDEKVHDIRLAMFDSMVKGCVQIRDTQGDLSCGQFGEISATAAKSAGCVGAVIDGSTRDSNYLIDMAFPTFCRFRNPVEAFGRFMVVDYQIPIYVQGMNGKLMVSPGDYIFGDNDGVVIVPQDLTIKVLEMAEEWFESEGRSREAMAQGKNPFKVYQEFGRF